MIKIQGDRKHGQVVTMDEMKPLEIGVICDAPVKNSIGHVVFRTASTQDFEVIDFTDAERDGCWTDRRSVIEIKVFIPKEAEFNLTISNL